MTDETKIELIIDALNKCWAFNLPSATKFAGFGDAVTTNECKLVVLLPILAEYLNPAIIERMQTIRKNDNYPVMTEIALKCARAIFGEEKTQEELLKEMNEYASKNQHLITQ